MLPLRHAELACAIADEIGLTDEHIEGIRMAGIVHEIGKISVHAEILNKPRSSPKNSLKKA
jgi:HD-GYP domain-containing protein (c-di-GMP phosphodiesterase class II)